MEKHYYYDFETGKWLSTWHFILRVYLARGEFIEKVQSDNNYGYEWAIYTITTA